MRSTAIRCAGFGCLAFAVWLPTCRGDELIELGRRYKQLEDEWLRALPANGAEVSDAAVSDDEWMRRERALEAEHPGPDEQLLPRFLAFAEANPDSPHALDALAFVIRRGGSQTGDVEGRPWQLKEAAIDIVSQRHMDDPRIVHIFDMLWGALPSPKTEKLLRTKFDRSDDRARQAAAQLSLARHLSHTRQAHERSEQLRGNARPLNYERFWRVVVTPYLEREYRGDSESVMHEVEQILTHVRDEYSDVPAMDWTLSGPGHVLLQSKPFDPPTTYGELARAMLFEIQQLAPGKQAPEIEGTDAEGRQFRLSDYRGKVVLLTFSANWCEGCVELYPVQRKLVEKYRDEPFALLSVSRDEQVDTLKSALASGKITWRCWWDGMHGPIYRAWNSPGAPKLYLLDHEGTIQPVRLNRHTPQAEFEQAIEPLLQRAVAPST